MLEQLHRNAWEEEKFLVQVTFEARILMSVGSRILQLSDPHVHLHIHMYIGAVLCTNL